MLMYPTFNRPQTIPVISIPHSLSLLLSLSFTLSTLGRPSLSTDPHPTSLEKGRRTRFTILTLPPSTSIISTHPPTSTTGTGVLSIFTVQTGNPNFGRSLRSARTLSSNKNKRLQGTSGGPPVPAESVSQVTRPTP